MFRHQTCPSLYGVTTSREFLVTRPIRPCLRKALGLYGALSLLVASAILLAGCGASLHDDQALEVGQQPGNAIAAGATAPEKADDVTTASTKAPPDGELVVAEKESSRAVAPTSTGIGEQPNPESRSQVETAVLSMPDSAASNAKPEPTAVRLPASAESFTSLAEPGHVAYRIGPLDVLEISVFRVPELSTTVQVADTGTINLPLIGEVPASGRTAKEVEQDVTTRLGEKYLQNPQVTVFIKEYNARRFTVDGSVKKPGVYPLRGRTSLLQAITIAEGLDNDRASGDVVVFRQVNGQRTAARFNLNEIRDGTAKDPLIESGDVIIVDDSTAKVVLHNVLRVLPVTNVFMGVF